MAVRIAYIRYNDWQKLWELSLEGDGRHPEGQRIGMDGFESMHNAGDIERVTGILLSWGARVVPGRPWTEDDHGRIIVPIQVLEG